MTIVFNQMQHSLHGLDGFVFGYLSSLPLVIKDELGAEDLGLV